MLTAVKDWIEAPFGPLGPVDLSRIRVQHLIVFLLNLVGLPYTKLFFGTGLRVTAAVLLLVITSSTASLFLLTRRGKPWTGGRLVSITFFITISVALWGRGGMTSNSAAWLLLTPVLAFMMVGPRHGMGIGYAAAFEFVLLWALETAGLVTFPAGLPADVKAWLVVFDYPIIALTISAILWIQAGLWEGVIARLDQANGALEVQVEERKEAEQRALAAAKARYTFLATMSHEIRTPLNGVLGLTDVLLDSEMSEDQRHLAKTVKDSGQLLRTLLDDVLDFSKIDSGVLEVEHVPFDLAKLCEDIVRLWAPTAFERGLALHCPFPAHAPRIVVGDPTRLRQILGNLVSNALKFTEQGEVEILVRAEGDTLELAVRDTGRGVAPEAMDQIFEPFRQADSTTTRKHGGTGLGLAICQRLARALEGELTVDSRLGEGATFTLRLPLRVADALPETAQAATSTECLAGRQVLVAEDNPVNQMVIRRLLERLEVKVSMVPDGQACLDAYRATPPDIILMDCQMPLMDGYDATRRLRKDGARLPIVALTANTMPGDRMRCIEAGMDDHIGKPVRAEELEATLARWLS